MRFCRNNILPLYVSRQLIDQTNVIGLTIGVYKLMKIDNWTCFFLRTFNKIKRKFFETPHYNGIVLVCSVWHAKSSPVHTSSHAKQPMNIVLECDGRQS